MPSSIASLASGGGASAAAVASDAARRTSATTRAAVGAQQLDQAAQLAPAAARSRASAADAASSRSGAPLTAPPPRSIGSRLRNTWSGRPFSTISRVQRRSRRAAPRACRARRSRPSSSTTMSSASAIVESRWAITNVVRPAITSRSASLISCSVEASTERGGVVEDRGCAGRRAAPARSRSAGAGRRESVSPRSPTSVS